MNFDRPNEFFLKLFIGANIDSNNYRERHQINTEINMEGYNESDLIRTPLAISRVQSPDT
jgi:GTP cyclohydrolase I